MPLPGDELILRLEKVDVTGGGRGDDDSSDLIERCTHILPGRIAVPKGTDPVKAIFPVGARPMGMPAPFPEKNFIWQLVPAVASTGDEAY